MAKILITGTSTGIGLATVKLLAQEGHRVFATARNPDKSSELVQLANQKNMAVSLHQMDVDKTDQVESVVGNILRENGFVDVLINNAGIALRGAVEEMPIDFFQSSMETNYLGTVRCIKTVLPSMRERKKGLIINVTSVAGKLFSQSNGAYCASKAAVEALSESLAQEVAHFNIRVAIVEPGVIETPIFGKMTPIPSGQTHYPTLKRIDAFFAASLEKHIHPDIVAAAIHDIVEGRSTKFRNPVGPDALPLLQWRSSTLDELWINAHLMDDETWIKSQEDHGLNVRPYMMEK